ncbi:MAG: SUMF1/EgtB/PvdO family nonheme iron enzyme [Cyanobacteria bacterium P01_F01_bin.53]
MSRIFISYRRGDSAAEAGRIYDYLEARLDRTALFKDVDTISGGDNFRQRLNEALDVCQILLVVIGKSWLQTKDAAGRRRLDNPNDWVRLEVEAALQRNIRVIPLLLDGVPTLSVADLPGSLKALAERQALFVRNDPDFRRDMERVLTVIRQHSEGKRRAIVSGGASLSRRRALQILGLSGTGLGAALIAKTLLPAATEPSGEGTTTPSPSGAVDDSPPSSEPPLPSPEPPSPPLADWEMPALEPPTVNGVSAEFNVATVNVSDKSIEVERKQAEFYTEDLGNSVTLDMMAIPSGSFQMGSPSLESDRVDNEGPQHEVSVPPFFMGKYAVTQAQWRAIVALPKVKRDLKASPAHFQGDERPVESVSWDEAVEFCQRLSAKTGRAYRLPSEAEWEYACRAGTTTPFYVGETITLSLANYRGNVNYAAGPKGDYRQETTAVGSFPANAFGLYDMHGNVSEWCADHWHDNYVGAPTDGSTWLSDGATDGRIRRGGSWFSMPSGCRSAYRFTDVPANRNNLLGFRVSCSPPQA